MTTNITSAPGPATSAVVGASTRRTRLLLAGGAVAGPLFIVVGIAQALTRDGFDPVKHPLSLLSLGDLGWIQISNFVVAGLLFLGGAVGIRRALHPSRGGTWGPWLYGAFGVALVAGGVFVADASLGFPVGTPDGVPETMSWHGVAHGFAPATGFLSLSLASFVLARRSYGLGERRWATLSVAVGVGIQVLGAISTSTMNFIPLWIAMVLGFGWASAQAARLMAGSSELA